MVSGMFFYMSLRFPIFLQKNKSVKIMLLYKSRREPTLEFPAKPEVLSGPYFLSLLLTPGSSHRVPMSVYKIISD